MAHTYEIEIKSLLGEKKDADAFRARLVARVPALAEKGRHSQLNHYFVAPADLSLLKEKLLPYIPDDKKDDWERILTEGKNHSIRTRDADGEVFFIVKASIGDDTSANGVSRIEFEVLVGLSLDALDQLIIAAGSSYQAKWSRDREEYVANGMNITIDRNAGYGYLAEFERIIDDVSLVEAARDEIRGFMRELEAQELSQERIERMFAHYNEHWQEYYGTDKVFTIL